MLRESSFEYLDCVKYLPSNKSSTYVYESPNQTMTLIVMTQYFILVFVYSRNPFPPGEKVVSKGSQYVCQQCSAKETRSDVRGPKLESKSNARYIPPTCNTSLLILISIIQFIFFLSFHWLRTHHVIYK